MSSPATGSCALAAVDTALARGRHAEALGLLERALARGTSSGDLRLRLHLARGHALWLSGRTRAGAAEVEKARPDCREAFTRARALDLLGLFAWKAQRLDHASVLLAEAQALWAAGDPARGAARTLWRRAGVRRDGGCLEEALALQQQAVFAAQACGCDDATAEARTGLGLILDAMGRWEEAREELGAAAALFAAAGDPREHTRAGLARALVELSAGELGAARESLARASAGVCPDGSDPRTLGEIALVRSDLLLAEGSPEGALAEAGQALALLAAAEGETRARIRMVHCLLALDRRAEALSHARRALEAAGDARPDLRTIALVTLGRAHLRGDRAAAERAFAAALPVAGSRPSFEAAARLGVALARGCGRTHPDVAGPLQALEAWGDRRFLSHCLAAVDDALGPEAAMSSVTAVTTAEEDPGARALADAAVALATADPWPSRWAAAMRAMAPVLRWWRAVLAAEPGWVLRRDLEEPQPLRAGDLAHCVAPRGAGPFRVSLASDPALRRHPQRVLHGLGTALVAPAREGVSLQVELREGCAVGERELALLAELARLVGRHLDEAAPAQEPHEAPSAFGELEGRCAAMRAVLREAAHVAPGPATVHVHGETGTGKERLARALHLASARARGPWVPVNASSISDELFESEMFGHVKGAFTGALADRRGYVAEAEGGTLFLDEVTDLSARGQAKLLRFLQEREYRRVGDPRMHRADVRIVTASNAALEDRVAAGLFRADLMYRLNQHVLELPPLRERGEDIVLLARHHLRRAAEQGGLSVPVLTREAATRLLRYDWPGNVRELESEMGRALMRCRGASAVRPEHLSLFLTRPVAPRLPLRQAVVAFERGHIEQALFRNRGNRSRTAVELGLSRQALLAKISRMGIASLCHAGRE
jgi:DNA-binding NtrC family response regulator/tetratricopeptide (TPR) repeat protein